MQDLGSGLAVSGLQSALLFESPEEIYARVFREFKPRTPLPKIAVEFCRFANADSFIRMQSGAIQVRIALPRTASGSIRTGATCGAKCTWSARSEAAKFVSGPQGSHYNLEAVFEALNAERFQGLLARPKLKQYAMFRGTLHLRYRVGQGGARKAGTYA
jgi:hypothetical protein